MWHLLAPILLIFLRINEHASQLLVGPNALWLTQPKFWVSHGPRGPPYSALHVVKIFYTARPNPRRTVLIGQDATRWSESRSWHIKEDGTPPLALCATCSVPADQTPARNINRTFNNKNPKSFWRSAGPGWVMNVSRDWPDRPPPPPPQVERALGPVPAQWRRQLWKSTRSWQGPENICQVLTGTKMKFKN